MNSVLMREKRVRFEIQRHRGVVHMEMKVEIRAILLQTKKSQEPAVAGRGKAGLTPRDFRGSAVLVTP